MPRVLIYDIETSLLKFWGFGLGKQVLRHHQLDETTLNYGIICICYMYSDESKVRTLHWGNGPDIEPVVEKFDNVIQTAQNEGTVIIGKNNKRFDDKHINTQRWLQGLPPLPDWIKYTQDLEQQIRRYMYLPSNSLDAISKLRGLGGKESTEFNDWINISNYKKALQLISVIGKKNTSNISHMEFGSSLSNILREGKASFKKMIHYCQKDVKDTMDLFKDVGKHCEWRRMAPSSIEDSCKHCGSNNIRKNGTRGEYQSFWCNSCQTYAGRAILKKDGTTGKIY